MSKKKVAEAAPPVPTDTVERPRSALGPVLRRERDQANGAAGGFLVEHS